MTVLARNNEPQGTYTEGYDAGLEDAANRRPRKYRRPTGRERNASFYRFGYSEGYDDGVDRRGVALQSQEAGE